MKNRLLILMGVLAASITFLSTGSARLGAQASEPIKPYVTPRTPWGDPDLQGNLTNLYEVGTPFERPDEFAGRHLDDVKGQELTNIRRSIQERTRADELAGEIGGTRWIWLDSFQHEKGSTAWFVVDPPDGRIPPLTQEGQRRAAARAETDRSVVAVRPTPTKTEACSTAASRGDYPIP
jgi:hypothetical protein